MTIEHDFLGRQLDAIMAAETKRLFDLYTKPFLPMIPVPKADPLDAIGYGLRYGFGLGYGYSPIVALHDELITTQNRKARDTMTKKQTTIESTSQPSTRYGAKFGAFEHTAKVKYGQPYGVEALIGKATSEASMAAAAEQLVLDLETAAREARAAYEAAGLVKPVPAPKPTHAETVAQGLAELLTKDLGEGKGVAVEREIDAQVTVPPNGQPPFYSGPCTERVTIKSANGTEVRYMRAIPEAERPKIDPTKRQSIQVGPFAFMVTKP